MSGWPVRPLAECCEIVSGATPSTSVKDYWDGPVRWATPKDLSDLGGVQYITETARRITEAGLNSCATTVLPPNSVLFSSRAPIGLVAINTVPMATNQGFKSLIPMPEVLDGKYLFHWLRANRAYLDGLGNGATFKEVSKATVARIEIPLPPVAEQRRIAAILDLADSLTAKRRAALERLQRLPASLLHEMFGDPIANPMRWNAQPLKDVCETVQIGPFGSQLHESDYVASEVPVINPTHLRDLEINPDWELTVPSRKADDLPQYRLKRGDIVVGRRGEMGRCALVGPQEEGWLCGTGSLFLRPKAAQLHPVYLLHALSAPSVKKYLERQAKGITMANLNREIIGAVRIPLPPLDSQHRFARAVGSIRSVQEAQYRSKAELLSLQASLQARAFGGKLV